MYIICSRENIEGLQNLKCSDYCLLIHLHKLLPEVLNELHFFINLLIKY